MLKKTICVLLLLLFLTFVAVLLRLPFAFIVFLSFLCYVSLFTCVLAPLCLLAPVIKQYAKKHRIVLPLTIVLFSVYSCIVLYVLFIISAPYSAPRPQRIMVDGPLRASLALRTLPYVSWAPSQNTDKRSVTNYIPESCFQGINIFTTRHPYTYLMDMHGNILHTWALDEKEHLSGYSEMCENGDLLTGVVDKEFVKLGWNSNRIWTKKIRCHHRFYTAENGNIYVVARKDSLVFCRGWPVPILEDYIAILSPDGKLTKEIRFYNSVERIFPKKRLMYIYRSIINPKNLIRIIWRKITGNYLFEHDTCFDIMHTNSVELLTRNVRGLGKKGDMLLSIREIDFVGTLNVESKKMVWAWGPGILCRQHYPTVLDNGNVLIFDNGRFKGYSRILEVNPSTRRIVWDYNSDARKKFFTGGGGVVQRLPNGNTLITETNGGRAFEVTKNGTIVWQYYNPNVKKKSRKRETIFSFKRITDPEKYPKLKTLKSPL